MVAASTTCRELLATSWARLSTWVNHDVEPRTTKRMAMGTAMTTRPLVLMDLSIHLVPSRCPPDASLMAAPLTEERQLSSEGEQTKRSRRVPRRFEDTEGQGGTASILDA